MRISIYCFDEKCRSHATLTKITTLFMNANCKVSDTQKRDVQEKDKHIIITMFPLECDHSLANRF